MLSGNNHLKPDKQSAGVRRGFIAMFLSASVAGCAYHSGLIDEHYSQFKARMPESDKRLRVQRLRLPDANRVPVHQRRHRHLAIDDVGEEDGHPRG